MSHKKRLCVYCGDNVMFGSTIYCIQCVEPIRLEVDSVPIRYSHFNNDLVGDCVCKGKCTHFCKMQLRSEAHCLGISRLLEPLLINQKSWCDKCKLAVLKAFPVPRGVLIDVLMNLVIEYLGSEITIIDQHGTLSHLSCVLYHDVSHSFLFTVGKTLCDICLTPVGGDMIYFNNCKCIMERNCFERAIAKHSYAFCPEERILVVCPSRKHVKCKACFWCDY
jgi:hypothetical protein